MKAKKKRKKLIIAVVVSKFNQDISEGLLNGALKVLQEYKIPLKRIKIYHCPGAFEIPLVAKKLCRTKKFDAVICLGAVIKGETAHFEYISDSVARGMAQLNLMYNIPVTFGVLTCYSEEQAVKRSSDDSGNKGAEAARAAIEMIDLLSQIK
ncbi:MAG: 6,7-dimethyl-8-ribityllumazine synthase [Ignavibacteria bacterium]